MNYWTPALAASAMLAISASANAQTPPGNSTAEPATDSGAASQSGASSVQSGPVGSPARTAPRSEDTRLAAIVPSGMTTKDACDGFMTVKQCAAALHASQNLNIPFADLKSKMTAGERLTAAINDLKPGTDAKAEVRKAEEQARMDMRPPKG